MLAAAAAAGRSTYLYWLPCRGSMYYHGYDEDKFSDLCLRRMDGGNASEMPWESELNMAAMALLGVAWLTLVLGLRWRLRTKTVAALPGLATLAVALAGAMAIGDVRQAGIAPTDSAMLVEAAPLMLAGVLIIELLAVVALLWILAWQSEARGRHILRPAVVLWGTTAFGAVHLTAEYIIMTPLSRWNLGFGYLTVATITISAILTAIMTLRMPHTSEKRQAAARPHEAAHTG
jgi:hypothetical protein